MILTKPTYAEANGQEINYLLKLSGVASDFSVLSFIIVNSEHWKALQIQYIPYAHVHITGINTILSILSGYQSEGNIFAGTQQDKLLSSYYFYITYFQLFFPSVKNYPHSATKILFFLPGSSIPAVSDISGIPAPCQLYTAQHRFSVLSQQPHVKLVQLILSQTRTSSLYGGRSVQGASFISSGRSSQPSGVRDSIFFLLRGV